MAEKYVMINDIIEEHNARMQNLRKYYPFFALAETTFAQYKEGRYASLDMGYITMAILRFFIQENSFNEHDVSYDEYADFMKILLARDFDVEIAAEDADELVMYIFDKVKNDGRAFEFRFYDPGKKQQRVGRVKLIDSRIEEGRVLYFITADGIEFYLDTKEIKDESKINVQQLLLEKMIVGENFKGGIEVVRRINSEVNRLIREKDDIVNLLSIDVFRGAEEYERYMKTVARWFADEQKLFAKNKALVDKAVAKANYGEKRHEGIGISYETAADDGKSGVMPGRKSAMDDISRLELELKRTIIRHNSLISSTMELQDISDNIIHKAKLQRLRPSFDFAAQLQNIIRDDRPDRMLTVLVPLFAPRTAKSFSLTSIDRMLTLRPDDGAKTTKKVKEQRDADFVYEDELLDAQISGNFVKLFHELLERLAKWKTLSLREFNGILEIKFGKEIYAGKDYYAFLAHLAQKERYSVDEILDRPDTMLEGILAEYEEKLQAAGGESCSSGASSGTSLAGGSAAAGGGRTSDGHGSTGSLRENGLSREMYAPSLSLAPYRGMEFTLEYRSGDEIEVGDGMCVSDMVFRVK